MIETLNHLIVGAMDVVLAWILYLPRDLQLLILAAMTSAALTLTRKWGTDQEWLGRAAADQRRLARMWKEAKRNKDREAVARHKATLTLIRMRSLRFEWKPLLWAIVPVALLAAWAFSRLAFVPPTAGEPLEVRARLPQSAVGQWLHVAPEEGLVAVDGWVQPVAAEVPPPAAGWWDLAGERLGALRRQPATPVGGVAIWHIASRDAKTHALKVRYAGRTYEKAFTAGARRYATPLETYPDAPVREIALGMQPLRLFGVIGGIRCGGCFLPPWLVGYLLITIAFVPLLKRFLRVY